MPANEDEEGDEEPGPSPEALAVRAFDRVRRLAPFPRIVAAPDGVGLTGLPTFVWLSEEQPTLQATAGAGGLTVTAEASATSFTWGFGDGPPRVTSTGGEPWTRTSPGSVSHTYERKGSYEMTVVVLWTARWRVGAGPWLPLGSFTTEGGRDYAVRQVVAVLKRSAR